MVRPLGGREAAAADAEIRHVSDTALWVATFRALESQRRGVAFQDPLASLLAGDRGAAIARAMPRAAMVEWGMVIRTSAIDQLVHEALSGGVDTVLNLGAGLDTRPYRLPLPATLRWVELDFPCIVDLKNIRLSDHTPVCQLERIGIDLLDRLACTAVIARYAANSRKTLFITEGVLPYLSVDDVAILAADLHADTAGHRKLPRGWEAKLKAAPFRFDVSHWFEFFDRHGWRSAHVITSFEESQRINRPYPLDFPFGLMMRTLPTAMREKILSLSGAVLLRCDPRPHPFA